MKWPKIKHLYVKTRIQWPHNFELAFALIIIWLLKYTWSYNRQHILNRSIFPPKFWPLPPPMSPLFYTLSLIYPDFLFRILLIFSNNLWTTPYLMHVMTSTNFLRLQAVLWVRLSENLGSSANILNRSRPCIPIWGHVWRILVWLEMSVLKRKFLVFQSQQSPLLVWIQSVHQQTRKKSHES